MNILHIKTSISGENSHSSKLANYIVEKHKELHPRWRGFVIRAYIYRCAKSPDIEQVIML